MPTPLQNINAEKIQGNLSITSVSATTYYNLPISSGISFTGGTVTGATYFTGGLTANTFSATTIYGNNLSITDSTQSLFSGNSSVELVKIVQSGSGDAFVVQDQANGDSSHFVINASGNTAIGLTAPLGNDKLTVSGNTSIYGVLNVNGNTLLQALSASTISATTYLNLPISIDTFVTGGTYSNNTFTYTNNTGGTFNTSFNTVTGLTINGNLTVTGNTNLKSLTATSATLSGSGSNVLTVIGSGDTSNPIFSIQNLSGDTIFSVADYTSGPLFWVDTVGGVPVLEVSESSPQLNVYGGISGTSLTANTISATTYYNLPIDVRVTGGTYTAGTVIFTNNTGGTFSVSGFSTSNATAFTGGTVTGATSFTNGLTANTISATTYLNLPIDVRVTGGTYSNSTGITTFTNNTGGTFTVNGYFKPSDDIYTTGLTFNASTYDLSITRNDNTTFTQSLAVLASDMTVTGGTYNPNSGVATFTNNTGGTFNVSGFLTGMTDTYVTGLTYSANVLTLKQTNNQADLSVLFNTMTGLTATTLYTDYVDLNTNYTGATTQGRLSWDSGTGTLNIGVGDTGGTLIDLQVGQEELVRVYNSEATTLLRGEIVYVFGSQGNRPSVKRAIATSDGYSVTTLGMVTSDVTSGSEGYVTTFGIISNLNTNGLSGGTAIWLSPTIAGGYTATKPQAPYHTVLIGYVVRVDATVGSVFINISNGWEIDELHDVRINDKTSGDLLSLSAYNGYDVWVNTKTLNGSYTITGNTTVGGQMSAGSVSATTYYNLPTDIRVTGATYSNNTFTYTNNTGGTFNVLFNNMTGLTLNGNLTVTGNTTISGTTTVGGDIITNGYLRSYNSTGDEGGEIFLSKAVTNTTLNNGVTIDVYQNKLRFFEQGGTARGVYIDLTAAGAGVSTNLLSGGGGEINTASNLGTGTGLFAQKSAADLQFKSLTSTGGTVTISNDSNTVNLEVVPASNFTGGTVSGTTNFISGLTANTFYTDYIDFNTSASATNQEGRLNWNSSDGTLDLGLKGGTVVLQLGQETLYEVRNETGSVIENGTALYASGVTAGSGRITVAPYVADGSIREVRFLGLATEDISNGINGFVTYFGYVRGLDTRGTSPSSIAVGDENWSVGDILYVHPTVAGKLTNVRPQHEIIVAIVIVRNQTNGVLFVRPSSFGHLDDLHDVEISGAINGDLLSLNETTNLWENTKTLNGSYTITGDTTIGGTLYSNSISATTYHNLPSTYSTGPISGATGWSNNSGEMNLPAIKVALADNANNLEPIRVYDIAAGTTGSGGITSLTNNDTNYVVVEYNGGSPRYQVYNNDGVVDDSSVVLVYIVYRLNTFIHVLEFGNYGAGLANKLNDRFMMTDRFGWESGLNISLSGSTGVIDLTAGVAWNGPYRQTLSGLNSQDDVFFKNFHSGGTWTYTTTGNTLNNTFYDNGTNIVTATAGKFLTNYYYRGQEINDHLYEVYSTNEYDSIIEAEAATNPELPELITSHAFLVGRIIVEVGASTGITQTAFGTVFQASGYAPSAGNHNDLSGLQGGTGGQYYHLTSNEYNNNAYTNVDNNFSTNQTINGNLTVTGEMSGTTNSISTNNLINVALLYLSNNT